MLGWSWRVHVQLAIGYGYAWSIRTHCTSSRNLPPAKQGTNVAAIAAMTVGAIPALVAMVSGGTDAQKEI